MVLDTRVEDVALDEVEAPSTRPMSEGVDVAIGWVVGRVVVAGNELEDVAVLETCIAMVLVATPPDPVIISGPLPPPC